VITPPVPGVGYVADSRTGGVACTGWGEHSADPVQRTVFLAAQRETDHVILRYEYESGLRALGIIPGRDRTWRRERGELGWGFSQPPRW